MLFLWMPAVDHTFVQIQILRLHDLEPYHPVEKLLQSAIAFVDLPSLATVLFVVQMPVQVVDAVRAILALNALHHVVAVLRQSSVLVALTFLVQQRWPVSLSLRFLGLRRSLLVRVIAFAER